MSLPSRLPLLSAPTVNQDIYPFTWKRYKKGDVLILQEHTDMKNYYEKIQQNHWIDKEVSYEDDARDWMRCTDDERACVRNILAFFAQADTMVINILESFESFVNECPYAAYYITEQKAQEQVHAITYQQQIHALGILQSEIEHTIGSFKTNPTLINIFSTIEQKIEEYTSSGCDIGKILVLDAFVEGVLFQGAFATLQWLRGKNILNGITKGNEFITRDEGVHTFAICEMFNYLKKEYKPDARFVYDTCDWVVTNAGAFISDGIRVGMIGLTRDSMNQFIKFQANCVLTALGYAVVEEAENPYNFMSAVSLNRVVKSNFFEVNHVGYGEVADNRALIIDLITTPIEY